MAIRVRRVVSDNSSQEVDELRRQFNNLLLVLENVCSEVDATTITADEAFTVLATTLAAGSDASITGVDSGGNDHAGTNRELNGVRPAPTHPRRARVQKTESADATIDF